MIKLALVAFTLLYSTHLWAAPVSKQDTLYPWFEKRQSWFIEQQLIKPEEKPTYVNRLIKQDSPYLLSHALQAVDWFALTDNPFAAAQSANKLVYLSIGYETCHWCHVLASESYENQQFAELLNTFFVSIKLDRERYPEIDHKYHRALANMIPNPGWPIQVVLTPDNNIVWIASYMEQKELYATLATLAKKWASAPASIASYAAMQQQQLLPPLRQASLSVSSTDVQSKQQRALATIRTLLKQEQAGQGPRFLRANWLLLLLDEYAKHNSSADLALVQQQVSQLLTSVSYDFIDGGMHRYGEDGDWQHPHFEKMLYDQGNLIRVLVRIYSLTGDDKYIAFAEQIIEFVTTFLKQDIGYASSLSAISAGTEGGYYKFTNNLFYTNDEQTNVGRVNDLLHLQQDTLLSADKIAALKQLRLGQSLPNVDSKSVLAWNALYLLSLTELLQVTDKQNVSESLLQLSQDIMQRFYQQNILNRIVFQGKASIPATVEDYAWLIIAFNQLYWTLDDEKYLTFIQTLSAPFVRLLNQADWPNLQFDSELPSSAGVSMFALQVLVEYHSAKTYYPVLNLLKSKFNFHDLNVDSASVISAWGKQILSTAKLVQPFAKGKGVARVQFLKGAAQIEIRLMPGWHINSNQPNDKSLIPTKLTLLNSSLELFVDYPTGNEKKLGLSQTVMNLYENKVLIPFSVKGNNNQKNILSLTLQACSQKVCLLPETLGLLY
jgi:uncharacterized protein YyaL (SSP411 family)